MLKLGLTGGIGSGKSTVAKIFETLGVPVYYADDAARRLMNEDEELKKNIINTFGPASYKDGVLNRSHIANLVFNNADKLAKLNSITHPATIRDANEWMANQTAPYVIKEAALLFESGANTQVDKVIGVFAPLETRIARVVKRDQVTREDVLKRINRQMNEEEKMKKCDFVLINDEKQLLLPQVIELDRKFEDFG
jgi:dephospho-CoA kinase